MDTSRLNLADGLKKAGTFSGIFSVRDKAGINNLVLPSRVSTISFSAKTTIRILFFVRYQSIVIK